MSQGVFSDRRSLSRRSGSRGLRRNRFSTEQRGPERTDALPPHDLALSIDVESGAVAVSARHKWLPHVLGDGRRNDRLAARGPLTRSSSSSTTWRSLKAVPRGLFPLA